MKRFMMILAGAILAIGVAKMPAQAATYNLGTLPDNGATFSVGGNFLPGHFSDTIKFNLASTSSISGFVQDVWVPFLANLTNLSISIDGTALSLNPQTGGTYMGAVLASLDAGNHSFKISGLANGLLGGAYLFKVAAVAATPIPPALLMFGTALAGLGAAGWRRRKALAA
ncbi:MAG TPA: hypothetical protein VGM43_26590 [Bryobacteraceae bacterium]